MTGASSGLGRHFARTLALNGARIGVAARRQEKLLDLIKELKGEGVADKDMFAVKMDVTGTRSAVRLRLAGNASSVAHPSGATRSVLPLQILPASRRLLQR